ncbi:MAG: nicotinate-nucleotide--dimethylbenzimidazole phosphoribosyltransferase [Thermoanaerobacterales bacterium]|nr:nicotinate-nucleotide--dimethylbenzimidazole phosphoribosyltransferase [Bacillota bacterium]MDI6906971.1 nicotinate-nucleotide--dimethylbenzimidazole phosphoribosyltransferase [Thermoanaerobacterales bacterium]
MQSTSLSEIISAIRPVDPDRLRAAQDHLDNLTKPRGSLGMLEEIAARMAALSREVRPAVRAARIFVFVGDHGVVEEGVSAYPPEVTTLMVHNFLAGGAAINVLARRAGAEVRVVDVGMRDRVDVPALINRNVRRGAGNIARRPAMSVEEAMQALMAGAEMAMQADSEGSTLIGLGEMGIGNTTPSAALYAALLPCAPREIVGKGTGLDAAGVARKIETVATVLAVNQERLTDPLSTLAAVGGLEIAAIAGCCLGAAACGLPVVVDGFISGAGALAAMRMAPAVRDYLFFSHVSAEAGHKLYFNREGLRPMLDLDMRLGEGTGAAIGMQIITDAVAIYNEMATFADVGIEPGA